MTREEFDKQEFSALLEIEYQDDKYKVMSVDFEERLIGFNLPTSDNLYWARCENVKLVNN